METSSFVEALAQYGPFAVLTFALIYMIWKGNSERESKLQETIDQVFEANAEREKQYQATIDKLIENLKSVEFMRKDIEEMKRLLTARGSV